MKNRLLKKLRKRAKEAINVSLIGESYLISYKPYYSDSSEYFCDNNRFSCINHSYFKENEIREKIRLALIEIVLDFVDEIKKQRKEEQVKKLVESI